MLLPSAGKPVVLDGAAKALRFFWEMLNVDLVL
jgi:hypothetical protein